jgi:hypothetical protein
VELELLRRNLIFEDHILVIRLSGHEEVTKAFLGTMAVFDGVGSVIWKQPRTSPLAT